MSSNCRAAPAYRPIVAANRKRLESEEFADSGDGGAQASAEPSSLEPLSSIIDLREYDVPYTMRVAIDLDLRVGAWYVVTPVPVSESRAGRV